MLYYLLTSLTTINKNDVIDSNNLLQDFTISGYFLWLVSTYFIKLNETYPINNSTIWSCSIKKLYNNFIGKIAFYSLASYDKNLLNEFTTN